MTMRTYETVISRRGLRVLNLLTITRLSRKGVCIYRDSDSRSVASDHAEHEFQTKKKVLSVNDCNQLEFANLREGIRALG